MKKSKIEWTDITWNPTTGCSKISSGCKNCYAEKMTKRLQAMGKEKYRDGFSVRCHPNTLQKPFNYKKPSMFFVDSMSDLFHDDVPFEFIKQVFNVMNENPKHIFQVLTKRTDNLMKYSKDLVWTENIWMGVSVEDQQNVYRVDALRQTDAKIKFISIEPLIGPVENINLENIDWVIVGGESGSGARPIKEEWVDDLLFQCQLNKVPFFFKQWGGPDKKRKGCLLQGQIWKEMPKCISSGK